MDDDLAVRRRLKYRAVRLQLRPEHFTNPKLLGGSGGTTPDGTGGTGDTQIDGDSNTENSDTMKNLIEDEKGRIIDTDTDKVVV